MGKKQADRIADSDDSSSSSEEAVSEFFSEAVAAAELGNTLEEINSGRRRLINPAPPVAEEQDGFTAPRCEECGRIDNGHTEECSKSGALRYENYLAFCQAQKMKVPAAAARKLELTRTRDQEVRAWLEGQSKPLSHPCRHEGCSGEAGPHHQYCEHHRAEQQQQEKVAPIKRRREKQRGKAKHYRSR